MIEILTSRVNPHLEPMTGEESLTYQINQEELESVYTEKVLCIPLNLIIEDQSELPDLCTTSRNQREICTVTYANDVVYHTQPKE